MKIKTSLVLAAIFGFACSGYLYKENSFLSQELSSANTDIENFSRQLDTCSTSVDSLSRENASLKQEQLEADTTIKNLERRLGSCSTALERKSTALEDCAAAKEIAEEKLDSLADLHSSTSKSLELEREKTDSLENELDNFKMLRNGQNYSHQRRHYQSRLGSSKSMKISNASDEKKSNLLSNIKQMNSNEKFELMLIALILLIIVIFLLIFLTSRGLIFRNLWY
ncbi:MAG: hypothetical protein AAF849_13200 [Bacteroidota bacterium]